MPKIKHVHFDGLRKITGWWPYTDEEIEDYYQINKRNICEGNDVKKVYIDAWNSYHSSAFHVTTYDELLKKSYDVFKEHYVNKDKKDQVHLFIVVNWQLRAFMKFMEKYDLWKYKVFETDWAGNKNYPDRNPYLSMKAFIFHYKD